jgi:hypothetical protein
MTFQKCKKPKSLKKSSLFFITITISEKTLKNADNKKYIIYKTTTPSHYILINIYIFGVSETSKYLKTQIKTSKHFKVPQNTDKNLKIAFKGEGG